MQQDTHTHKMFKNDWQVLHKDNECPVQNFIFIILKILFQHFPLFLLLSSNLKRRRKGGGGEIGLKSAPLISRAFDLEGKKEKKNCTTHSSRAPASQPKYTLTKHLIFPDQTYPLS